MNSEGTTKIGAFVTVQSMQTGKGKIIPCFYVVRKEKTQKIFPRLGFFIFVICLFERTRFFVVRLSTQMN